MKQLTIGFGVELDWVPNYAAQLEADIHGNNIMVGSTLFEGTRFAYQIDPNISFLVCDAIYKEDIHFKFKNTRSDFIEIHYNLSEDPGLYYLNNRANVVGRETYNLAILDSAINGEYVVKKGSAAFVLSIFIKKEAYVPYLSKMDGHEDILSTIFNPKFNTVIRNDRMTNKSWWLLNELRKKTCLRRFVPLFLLRYRLSTHCRIY